MENTTECSDTILWSDESVAYARRAFESRDNPYVDEHNERLAIEIKEFCKTRHFTVSSILHIGYSAGFKLYYLRPTFDSW